jgi:hypothetical protein
MQSNYVSQTNFSATAVNAAARRATVTVREA